MARFNTATVGQPVTANLAGGDAYAQSPELELVSILLTSFVQDQYYRSADDTIKRVKELVAQMTDKEFAAKAAIFARNEFGMRSISHVVAGEIALSVHGAAWGKRFFQKIVKRPDDMTEILSYYYANAPKRTEPNALKKGFAAVLAGLDEYALAKYRGEGKSVSLVDVVNLCHPGNTPALRALVAGTLKPAETWETKLSDAGKGEDVESAKGQVWSEMLSHNKLGYMALLKNLRNIIEQSPDALDLALSQLVDPEKIKKSLVLPFRYMTALAELEKVPGPGSRRAMIAAQQALDIAVSNVPVFPGKTLVTLDISGSMSGQPKAIGSLFAAILAKSQPDADLQVFGTGSQLVGINPLSPVYDIATKLQQLDGGGTNFNAIFQGIDRDYDRIIVLSDMQGWQENSFGSDLKSVFNEYKRRCGITPSLYSFDLAGHGTTKFPESQVYCIAGFSEKVFDMMKLLEEDRDGMVNKIKSVQL